MRIVITVMILLISFSGGVLGQPALEIKAGLPGEYHKLASPLWFWVDQTQEWSLHFDGGNLDYFYYADYQWHSAQEICEIESGNPDRLSKIELALKIPWLESGSYAHELEIEMQLGRGMLFYYEQELLWCLPLQSDYFVLKNSTGTHALVPNQWIKIASDHPDSQIFHAGTQIWPMQDDEEIVLQRNSVSNSVLSWRTPKFSVSTGRSFTIDLEFLHTGETSLELKLSEGLLPNLSTWRIGEYSVNVHQESTGWIVEIPPDLPEGRHTFSGQIIAGFSLDGEALVLARMGEVEVGLEGKIERGWFGNQGKVILLVSQEGKPAQYSRLILPDGSHAYTDKHGKLSFYVEPGIHRIIESHTKQVKWFVIEANQVLLVELELKHGEDNLDDHLVVWDIKYDQQLQWRLQIDAIDFNLDFNPSDQFKLRANLGSFGLDLHLNPDATNLEFAYINHFQHDPVLNGLTWQKTNEDIYGNLRHDNFRLGLRINRHSHELRITEISYGNQDPNWQIAMANNQFVFGSLVGDWLFRINSDLAERFAISLKAVDDRWRFQYDNQSWLLGGSLTFLGEWQWNYQSYRTGDRSFELDFERANYEVNFKHISNNSDKSSGLKLQPAWQFYWGQLSLSYAKLLTREIALTELGVYFQIPVFDKTNFDIGWINQKQGRQTNASLDLAFSVDLDQLMVQAGWNQRDGGYCRFGIALLETD